MKQKSTLRKRKPAKSENGIVPNDRCNRNLRNRQWEQISGSNRCLELMRLCWIRLQSNLLWCSRWDSNQQTEVFETSLFTNFLHLSVRREKRFRVCPCGRFLIQVRCIRNLHYDSGGPEGIRTPNLFLAKELHSQLCYRPIYQIYLDDLSHISFESN